MSGTVTRTGAVCMVEAQRALQCTKCKFRSAAAIAWWRRTSKGSGHLSAIHMVLAE